MNNRQRTVTTLLAVVAVTLGTSLIVGGSPAAEAQPMVPGDIDMDGIVGVPDLLLLLGTWGSCPAPCPPNCPADIDQDCTVAVPDLLILLSNWG